MNKNLTVARPDQRPARLVLQRLRPMTMRNKSHAVSRKPRGATVTFDPSVADGRHVTLLNL